MNGLAENPVSTKTVSKVTVKSIEKFLAVEVNKEKPDDKSVYAVIMYTK